MVADNGVRDSLGRRSRMRAHSTGKRIRLTDRDWIWLNALHRHGPLPSSYLLAFSKSNGRSLKRAKERLGDLFHENNTPHDGAYFLRPPQQFQTIDSRYNQVVYDLAPAGIRALKDIGSWNDRSGPSGGPWWHKLMVSCITASIHLGTIDDDEVSFIPQSKILDRADTNMAFPVSYLDPSSNESVTKTLKPDALFGFTYHTDQGDRFRFFVVEADRGTEPLASDSAARKSFTRSMLQYETLVVKGLYKQQLKLTSPLMVLFVSTSESRMNGMLKTSEQQTSPLAPAMLFQSWPTFGAKKQIPIINDMLVAGPWRRANFDSMKIA